MAKTIPHKKKSKPVPQPVMMIEPEVDFETLARQQKVTPIENPEELLGDFWPEDEDIEDFLATIKRWRREGK